MVVYTTPGHEQERSGSELGDRTLCRLARDYKCLPESAAVLYVVMVAYLILHRLIPRFVRST
jgi:hypothetical protein